MDNFKSFYNIQKDIPLKSKVDNNNLFVLYNDAWVRLNYKKNPNRFYSFNNLRQTYGTNLCYLLGFENQRKYSPDYYKKNQKRIMGYQMKYYYKKKREQRD